MENLKHKIMIVGDGANEALTLLRERLSETGNADSCVLQEAKSLSTVCTDEEFIYSLDTHDTPAFAVEKILDQLMDRGWISLDTGKLTVEEEEQIRIRLQGLGYID